MGISVTIAVGAAASVDPLGQLINDIAILAVAVDMVPDHHDDAAVELVALIQRTAATPRAASAAIP